MITNSLNSFKMIEQINYSTICNDRNYKLKPVTKDYLKLIIEPKKYMDCKLDSIERTSTRNLHLLVTGSESPILKMNIEKCMIEYDNIIDLSYHLVDFISAN